MWSLLVLVAAAFVPILEINGAATTKFDINAILDIIRTQQKIAKTVNREVVSSSDSNLETVENENEDEPYLRSRELIRLLHQTLDEAQRRKHKERKQGKYKYQTYGNGLVNNKKDDDSHEAKKNGYPVDRFIQHLITQFDKNERKLPDKVTKRKLNSGSLLDSYVQEKEKKDIADGLSEYSRIYVILNTEAFRTSQNQKQLTDVISRLLANSAPALQSSDNGLKEVRYKGFPVRGSLSQRRSRRESAEDYGRRARDSMEDSYKRKRPRSLRSRNRGGGHTAIPYIQHRGDIYDRD